MIALLDIQQVAELLRCEAGTVAEHCNRGVLPAFKFGRSWLVPEEALRSRLNEIALEESEQRRIDMGAAVSMATRAAVRNRRSSTSKEKPESAVPIIPVGPGRTPVDAATLMSTGVSAKSGRDRKARVSPLLTDEQLKILAIFPWKK